MSRLFDLHPALGGAALLCIAVALVVVPLGAISDDLSERFCRIRTTDHQLRAALEAGIRRSPTFRELVLRVDASDVIVYLSCGTFELPHGIEGRLAFMASGGGYRYVDVRVNTHLSLARQVAIIGHELQHVIEISDTDSIFDADSMASAYTRRLGFAKSSAKLHQHAFDSKAAIEAGDRVLREMLAAP